MGQNFDEFLKYVSENIESFTEDECGQIQDSIKQVRQMERIEFARKDFLTFVQLCGEKGLVFSSKGQHHMVAQRFEEMTFGDLKRLTISMPPRFGKSSLGSICFPAWYIGNFPHHKVIIASSKDRLASEFGRRVKALIDSEMYKRIFPNVYLTNDSKSKSQFATNHGGLFNALGTGAAAAGVGADLYCVDDCVSEQDAKTGNLDAYDSAWAWVQQGVFQRLQPGGRIVFIATRWSRYDPIGRVQQKMKEDKNYERWISIEFPALGEDGESMFPEVWSTAELVKRKNSMLEQYWLAQYQQDPRNLEGSILPESLWVKHSKFKKVPGSNEVDFQPPDCSYTIMSIDTSYTSTERSDPSCVTLWGIFSEKDIETKEDVQNIILLWASEQKLEFPQLKRKVIEWNKEFEPDTLLIEDRGSGTVLLQELRRSGISCTGSKVKGTEDKVLRLNSVTDLFASKRVHYIPTACCNKVILQCSEFPGGEHDDYVDTVSQCLRYVRKNGAIKPMADYKMVQEEYFGPPEGFC